MTGCTLTPTHTPAQAQAAIEQVCRDQFRMTVSTRIIGQTIYAHTKLPGFLRRLSETGEFNRSDSDMIGDLLVATTTVSLSTAPPIDFYVLRLSDPEAPGTELRYVTYLDDIRRLYANALAEMEFFDRRIQELKLRPREFVMTDAWMEREVRLGEFLAVQLAMRIKALALGEASPLRAWQLEECVGWYDDRTLMLTIVRNIDESAAAPATSVVPEEILQLIARVLGEYAFTEYDRLTITDTSLQHTHAFTRADIERLFVKR